MKKLLSISAAALAALSLFGCSNDSEPQKNIVADFSANAVITYGSGEQEEAFISSDLKGVSLILNSGTLDGLKYECDGKTTAISLDGMSVQNSAGCFSSSVPCALYNSICSLRAGKSLTVSSNGGRSVYQGKNKSGSFLATVDPETGYIEKIEYSDINFSAAMTEVREYK